MRKLKRLEPHELAPYTWELPKHLQFRWGDPAQTEAPAQAIEPVAPIDWKQFFGNDNPVEIEVGFGKGLFLVNTGQQNPDRNYFGIEIIRKYQLYAASRIASRGMKNVRVCCGDAKLVMRLFVPAASVTAVHVYFPDPWWKQRHRKRLLFTEEFAELIERVLRPGGHLHFVTDVEDYFEMVSGLLADRPGLQFVHKPEAHEPTHDMDYLTNFERKFRKEGRPIYRSLYLRSP